MDAVILEAVRTPRARAKPGQGALAGVHPQVLLAEVLTAAIERAGVPIQDVEDVIAGCVTQAGEQGANIARLAVLTAGWPVEVPGTTVARACGSGLQAVNGAAMAVASGAASLIVAGGVESMSRAPMRSDGAWQDGHNALLRARSHFIPQGISADLIATLDGITREDVDRFALRSQQLAATARAAGHFRRSLVPVHDPSTGVVLLSEDNHPRPETTLAALAALPPAFAAMGNEALTPDGPTFDEIAVRAYPEARPLRHVHTAGNSSGIADGAAAVVVASPAYPRERGLRPRARVRAMATLGADPITMLTAPADTCRRALAKAGMAVGDVDLWEINEAFAVVPIQTMRRLEIDPDRVNVNGGAIALGHPLGATGAMLLGTALDELERRGLATACITLCTAGGMGIATIIERM
ncbi:MAG: acetyl-CoA acetyltransferase [Dehalococcoidia bacterium]|nr:MAG: acetyl-CoA acetyltransferase [Dehalococcoidia bacterium]